MRIGKKFHFDSAHFLEGHETCGKIHGHTWKLKVELEGPIDPKTGMVADFKYLSRVVNDLISYLDHQVINSKFPETDLLSSRPTCEWIAVWFATKLAVQIPEPIKKVIITLQEGLGGWATYEHDIHR